MSNYEVTETGNVPIISRDGSHGWRLLDPTSAAVLHEGHLWGLPSLFEKQEIAAHRRDSLLHLLRTCEDGLQIVQATKMLRACEWMKAPATKDLLKVDTQLLQEQGLIRRVSNSKKWRAVETTTVTSR